LPPWLRNVPAAENCKIKNGDVLWIERDASYNCSNLRARLRGFPQRPFNPFAGE
jgi:hypothetical protein